MFVKITPSVTDKIKTFKTFVRFIFIGFFSFVFCRLGTETTAIRFDSDYLGQICTQQRSIKNYEEDSSSGVFRRDQTEVDS